jgi:ABC-type multidrug transport system ATPase subunit
MSTHTLAVAEEIADRIGIMDQGRLHFLGTVGELQRELASHHTALEPLFLELTSGNNGKMKGGRQKGEAGEQNFSERLVGGAFPPSSVVPLPPSESPET